VILITEFMDTAAVDELSAAFPTTYAPDLADTQDKIAEMLGDVRALIVRNRTQVTAELLDAAPNLKCVGRLGVGLDNIDQSACKARGVAVIPAIGANNLSVAEYVITNALILLRNAYQSGEAMRAGNWPRMACAGREISGKTLGLIGFGAIAQETAVMASALGMEICAHDPFLPDDHSAWSQAQPLTLEGVLASADVISLHVPLTADTHHLINADRLAMVKPDTVLINAARGGVVDEAAVANSLRAGKLAGAALDVFETEPLTTAASQKFQGIENLILTPHIAGVTVESNIRVSALIAERVLGILSKT
jgi:(S)-sulfolactate dehydrogenase